ncbi:MAG: CoB--CoM heterodisulfide reductase iron-sulfur subunit A family protein, partial [Anaerolineales bacterium]
MPENKDPRIGVYVCHCGGNISGTVQCELVAKVLSKYPGVAVTRTHEAMCSDAGQSMIEEDIKENGVNRVVVGACAPMLHEQTFRGAVTRAGLNPYLYHHVGLREQDSWVHGSDKQAATEKAIRLMGAGVAKARLLQPLDPIRLSAEKHALVIGGGVAGLKAALDVARQGLRVSLVEKSPFLGGHMAQLETVFPTEEGARNLLQALIHKVVAHPNVTVFTQAEIVGVSGYVGNFDIHVQQHSRGVNPENAEALMNASTAETDDSFNYGLTKRKLVYKPYEGCYPDLPAVDWDHYDGRPLDVGGWPVVLKDEPKSFELNVGAVVVATGFDPYTPPQGEYGFADFPRVITLPQLIRKLGLTKAGAPLEWDGREVHNLALIHCVGSRQVEGVQQPQADGKVNEYCSRVCCTASMHATASSRRK